MKAKGGRRARLRRIAAGRGREVVAERRDGPTPETAAKLRGDVILSLVKTGALSASHLDAALEIRTVHAAVGRAMFPRMADVARTGPSQRDFGPREIARSMSSAERRAWETRYLPWSHAMAVAVAAGLPGTRWLQLVIDIAVDNATPEEVETRYRLTPGAAVRFLAEGLGRYGQGAPAMKETAPSRAI